MTAQPPAPIGEPLARRAVRGRPWAETVLGDLREEFSEVAARRGRRLAELWYAGQALRLATGALGRAAAGMSVSLRSALFVGDRPMRTLWQETRFAARALRRQKLMSAAVVGTLALGLGANGAAFSLLQALVLRPFSFAGVDRVALISEYSAQDPFPRESVAPANFLDWRRQADDFDRMAAFAWGEVNLSGSDAPERVTGFNVTANFFDVVSAAPTAGRLFDAVDMTPGHDHVVVLGDALWRRDFGGRADVIGQPIRLDGEPYTVVGVAAPGFTFPLGAELWRPYTLTPGVMADRHDRRLTVIARLRPGSSFDDAQAQMAVIGARLKQAYPVDNGPYTPRVQTLAAGMIDPGMPEILGMIQAGALLVLAIGAANILSLLLAYGWDRQREIALRLAVGGSRVRVVRQLVVESLVLGASSVPVAFGVARVALSAFKMALPARVLPFVPGWNDIGLTPEVLTVIVGGAALTTACLGLLSALHASRPDLSATLREGGRTIAGGGSPQRVRRLFVVAQMALVLPLLVAAGLTAVGAYRFAEGPQGYDPAGLFVLQTTLPARPYAGAEARRQFADRMIAGAAALPGVEAAGTVNLMPNSDANTSRQIEIDGHPAADPAHPPEVPFRTASAGYFAAMRIPVLEGRAFSAADSPEAAPVAVVSRAMAEKFWPHEDAVGRRVRVLDGGRGPWLTVVGVAGDVIDDWFSFRNSPMLYVPVAQQPSFTVTLLARTEGDPAALASAVRGVLRGIDPNQPPTLVTTAAQMLRDRTAGLRAIGAIMATLGALAFLLATVGIYSLMAYYVAQRRHEIGVRMALGATRGEVFRSALGHAGRLSAVGLGLGLALAWLSSRLVEGVLFGIVTISPVLVAALALGLLAAALLASAVPAHQAARVDPAASLRAS
jgi:putative ABC transport system permease protein